MTPANRRPPLRIGIAGLGFGVDVHLPAFRSIADVEVIALLGRDPVRAAAIAAKTGLPVSTDLAAWLAAPFDAVSLALPPVEIEGVAAAAIDRGLPILGEKPLRPDPRAAHLLRHGRSGGRPRSISSSPNWTALRRSARRSRPAPSAVSATPPCCG